MQHTSLAIALPITLVYRHDVCAPVDVYLATTPLSQARHPPGPFGYKGPTCAQLHATRINAAGPGWGSAMYVEGGTQD